MNEPSFPITLREQLVALAELYCAGRGLSRSRVSTLLLGSGLILDRLAAGTSDINTKTFERAVKYLDAHWPDDLPWPEGLPRPSLSPANTSDEAA